MKKIFVETYGCQMNEYDTELIKTILAKAEYRFVSDELEADIMMLNTCAIREVYGWIQKSIDRFLISIALHRHGLLGRRGNSNKVSRDEIFQSRF